MEFWLSVQISLDQFSLHYQIPRWTLWTLCYIVLLDLEVEAVALANQNSDC